MSRFTDKHPNLPEGEGERRQERKLLLKAEYGTVLAAAIAEQSWLLVKSDLPLWHATVRWALGKPFKDDEEFLHQKIFDHKLRLWVYRGVPWKWISELRFFPREPTRAQLAQISMPGGVHGVKG